MTSAGVLDPRFDPRSPACPNFWSGEDLNDPSKPLRVYDSGGADRSLTVQTPTCSTLFVASLIVAFPSTSEAEEVLLDRLFGASPRTEGPSYKA